jgi:hypothetical protein
MFVGMAMGAGGLALAAPGDLIYQSSLGKQEVSAANAAAAGQYAKDAGLWDGEAADLLRVCVERDPNSSTGFMGFAVGLKYAAPGDLPTGSGPVPVVGIVE